MFTTILIVLFIINVLLWAWLDHKESETRYKAFFRDCELLEAKFNELLKRQEITIRLTNYYMNKYENLLDEILDYTSDSK